MSENSPNPAPEPVWMTVQQAADYLSVSTWTIHRDIAAGKIDGRRWGPRRVLVSRRSIDEALDRARIGANLATHK